MKIGIETGSADDQVQTSVISGDSYACKCKLPLQICVFINILLCSLNIQRVGREYVSYKTDEVKE